MRVNFTLTDSGRAKINKIVAGLIERIRTDLKNVVDNNVLDRVASHAPIRQDEARILSSGLTDTGMAWDIVDTQRGFIKGTQFKILRQGIKDQKSKISMSRRGVITSTVYHTPEFSSSVGFKWLTKTGEKSLAARTTADMDAYTATWNELVLKWENGGTYTVTPRDVGGRLLKSKKEAKGGFKFMTKTVPAFKMYKKGAADSKKTVKELIEKGLKTEATRLRWTV